MREPKIITDLNALSDAWKTQFNEPPAIPLDWHLDDLGDLYLNNLHICRGALIFPYEPIYNRERLIVETADGYFDILIRYPFDEMDPISEIIQHRIIDPKERREQLQDLAGRYNHIKNHA